jgi:ribosomal protein S18 acetylase RimI-like enzyme
MTNERILMDCKTESFDIKDLSSFRDLNLRLLQETDGKLLGELMYASYLGTVDYEGETLEETIAEAEATLGGKYGAVFFNASYIAFQKDDQTSAIGVTVVSDFEKTGPLLAFSLTLPAFQKRGIAALLIKISSDSLNKMALPKISLVVTSSNQPAMSLYRKLGFKPVC